MAEAIEAELTGVLWPSSRPIPTKTLTCRHCQRANRVEVPAALFAMGIASSLVGARLGPWSNRLAAASVMRDRAAVAAVAATRLLRVLFMVVLSWSARCSRW